MSLNNNVPISQHTGNGVTTSFLYDFKIFLAADLVVEVDGVVKTLNVDYSITGIGNDTGDVIFTVAPPAATAILLYRAVAFSRSIEYQYQGALPAVVVNRDIERLWMAAQELQTKIVRSFQLPLSVSGIDVTLPTPVAGRAVKWNATGTALIYSDQDPDEIAAAAAASAAAAAASQSASAANAAQTNLDRLAADAAASAAAASAASINPSNLMHLTGVETAAGIKTFTDSPVVPDLPDADGTTKAANAKFVQRAIAISARPSAAEVKARLDDAKRLTAKSLQDLIVLGTWQATTSGTFKDLTSIPPWAKRITVMLEGVSTNGASVPLLQLGDSGGIENTGYNGVSSTVATATVPAAWSTGVLLRGNSSDAASSYSGNVQLTLQNPATNTWSFFGILAMAGIATIQVSGTKALTDVLDRVRLTTVNGTDSFDAGSINIQYE